MKAAKNIQQIETYYFAKKLEEVRQLREQGKDIINLGIGSPDIEPPTSVITALQQATSSPGSSQYQAYKGIPELRQAFAQWYSRIYKVQLNPETQILPLMGSKEAIMHIHLAFCDPGDTVLIPNPGYPTYASSAKMLGLNAISYDLNEQTNWLPDLSSFSNATLEKTKVMWINYPNMPTGTSASTSDLKKIIEFAQKHGILLVNDNPYSLIRNDSPMSIHSIETDYEDIIELNSLSKSHNLSGWRVGIASGSSENISHLVKVKSNFDSGMFKPIQVAAIEALNLSKEWTDSLNRTYETRLERIKEILDCIGCTYLPDQVGLFVWAKIPNTISSGLELADKMLYEYDIFITPGIIFGTNGANYIRLSLCASVEVLDKALNRLKKTTTALCS